ncbi:hypothetical protein AWB79_01295 [Caballeronia hypogeia]|uniref:HNH nuclease domain-containing protein n=1 Tax=Caballeronia hypogeia TaxID=1777140 RepID=A0A157ZSI9_9BURK|nr:HNH endonuclease signature motif containing protein [Caballeronia hypogeia]SAK48492.1 hypothetical protein AWB79_01295 [Caballeronia hypogeia]
MMRLNKPQRDFGATLDECIAGITGNNAFKKKMIASKPDLVHAGTAYIAAGSAGELYAIAPISTAIKDPIVVGTLVKSELVNLYEYYFRNEEKESRATYDKLLNSAHEQCPFCGGIGTPRNLDHFLPKAHFPQFSTFPQNLVPSCRDCNMDGKAVAFATRAEDQLIQPYVDHDRFFTTQWIFAKCVLDSSNRPVSIHYYVNPPQEWDQVHKDRVQKHFDDFGLAKRFSVKAAQLLATTLAQIASLTNLRLSNSAIRTALLIPGINNAPFINHWQRGMFEALHDYLH